MGLLLIPSKMTGKFGKARAHALTQLFFVVIFTFGLINAAFSKVQCNSIKITAHPNDPPASWVNHDGELIGASIELAQQLLTQIGVNQIEIVPHPSVLQAVQSTLRGDTDLIAAIGMTFERSLQLYYIQPAYYRKLVVVVVRKNERFNLRSYDDLKIRRGTSGSDVSFGQSEFGKLVGVEIGTVPSKSVGESFDRLIRGAVDYNILYRNTAEAWITKNDLWNTVEILPVLAGTNTYYMGWSKLSKCRDTKFLTDLSEALAKAHDDEVFAGLLIKYDTMHVEELLTQRADSGRVQ